MNRRKSPFMLTAILLVSATSAVLSTAQSEEQLMSPGSSYEDHKNALSRVKMKTRSIRIKDSDNASGKSTTKEAASQTPVTPTTSDSVSVSVYFPFDSAKLTLRAKSELDQMGRALASPEFTHDRWLVEGHTDSAGSSDYNLHLSQRRAESVRQYIVEKHSVDPSRLEAIGKGEQDLLPSENPLSAKNRRVRLNYLGS